jgi:hypothetical protein
MSTDWATSKRWSSLQSTMLAASGDLSGQVRQLPALALAKAAVPLEPTNGSLPA